MGISLFCGGRTHIFCLCNALLPQTKLQRPSHGGVAITSGMEFRSSYCDSSTKSLVPLRNVLAADIQCSPVNYNTTNYRSNTLK